MLRSCHDGRHELVLSPDHHTVAVSVTAILGVVSIVLLVSREG